jgi:hypothetical protein
MCLANSCPKLGIELLFIKNLLKGDVIIMAFLRHFTLHLVVTNIKMVQYVLNPLFSNRHWYHHFPAHEKRGQTWGVKFAPFEVKIFHPSFKLFKQRKNPLILMAVKYMMLTT